MASPKQTLTRNWIQYLKNNQIVALQSNPKTGALNYKRQPTVTDLTNFLRKDFDEDQILDAIQTVMAGKDTDGDDETTTGGELAPQGSRDLSTFTPGKRYDGIDGPQPSTPPRGKKYNTDDAEDAKYSQRGVQPYKGTDKPSTWFNKEMTPGEYQDQIGAQMPWKAKPKKYNTDDAEDAQVKDKTPKLPGNEPEKLGMAPRALPNAERPEGKTPKRKPRFKYRYKKGQLQEAIRDWQGDSVSEKEVQDIFKILANPQKAAAVPQNATGSGQAAPAQAAIPSEQEQQEQIRRLKQVIRDTMTDQQRAALYRALTDV